MNMYRHVYTLYIPCMYTAFIQTWSVHGIYTSVHFKYVQTCLYQIEIYKHVCTIYRHGIYIFMYKHVFTWYRHGMYMFIQVYTLLTIYTHVHTMCRHVYSMYGIFFLVLCMSLSVQVTYQLHISHVCHCLYR
jgi:hypothetical protein